MELRNLQSDVHQRSQHDLGIIYTEGERERENLELSVQVTLILLLKRESSAKNIALKIKERKHKDTRELSEQCT